MSESIKDAERDLDRLEADLKRLEAEYTMYFAGRLKRPPVETRSRVLALVRRLDRSALTNYGIKYRLTALQTRLVKLTELWERTQRAREEGRPSPFAQAPPDARRGQTRDEG